LPFTLIVPPDQGENKLKLSVLRAFAVQKTKRTSRPLRSRRQERQETTISYFAGYNGKTKAMALGAVPFTRIVSPDQGITD